MARRCCELCEVAAGGLSDGGGSGTRSERLALAAAAEACGQVGGVDWSAEVVALAVVATQPVQFGQLVERLDAFGGDCQIELQAELDDPTDNRCGLRVGGGEAAGKRRVDLYSMDR